MKINTALSSLSKLRSTSSFLLLFVCFCVGQGTSRRFLQQWGDRWCRNSKIPETNRIKAHSLSLCALRCFQSGTKCRALSYQGNMSCYLYAYPRPTLFINCGQYEKPVLFFIQNGFDYSHLHFLSVENAALFKPTLMSSIHVWHAWNQRQKHIIPSAELAVDGYLGVETYKYPATVYCAVTSPQIFAWWRVDLLETFVVIEVVISSNELKIYNPLHDLVIRVGNSDIAVQKQQLKYLPFTGNTLCARTGETALSLGVHYFQCDAPVEGRFVSIQSTKTCVHGACEKMEHLVLCEVQVWAFIVHPAGRHNVAFLKPVLMPDYYKTNYPYLVTDGYAILEANPFQYAATDGNFSHPYLQIDLWSAYLIDAVVIVNLASPFEFRLHDFEIRVSSKAMEPKHAKEHFREGEVCASSSDTSHQGQYLYYSCPRLLWGRRVSVQLLKLCRRKECREMRNILALSEVIVYGTQTNPEPLNMIAALRKPVLQSSTDGKASPELANDGIVDLSTSSAQLLCTKTLVKDKLPWWRTDLLQDFYVIAVDIFTSKKDEGELHDFEIRVGHNDIANYNPFVPFRENSLCNSVKGAENEKMIRGRNRVTCSHPINGRFVSLQIVKLCDQPKCASETKNVLSLCEFRVFGYAAEFKNQTYDFVGEKIFWEAVDHAQMILTATATNQSSTWFAEVGPSLAADGDWKLRLKKNGAYKCTHTSPEPGKDIYPWWQMDLGRDVLVRQIQIFNRGEENEWRLRDFEIRVGNEDISQLPLNTVFVVNALCAAMIGQLAAEGWSRFHCRPNIVGRFLSIQIVRQCSDQTCVHDKNNILSLCEVHVRGIYQDEQPKQYYKNVALFKPTKLSSTESRHDSRLTVDGHTACIEIGPIFGCAVIKEDQGFDPWWQVDLEKSFEIYGVTIFSPLEEKNSFLDVEVRVGSVDISEIPLDTRILRNDVCTDIQDRPMSVVMDLKCKVAVAGQFVSVQTKIKGSSRKQLMLSEVRVWSPWKRPDIYAHQTDVESETNIALFKRTAQSSYRTSSYFAVDGKLCPNFKENETNLCCATTENEAYPWWQVDLEELYLVLRVLVFNHDGQEKTSLKLMIRVGSTDLRLHSSEGFASNRLCGEIPNERNEYKNETLCPTELIGRYVIVHVSEDCPKNECLTTTHALELCEIEIFGRHPDFKTTPTTVFNART